jgi:hypothetical protein
MQKALGAASTSHAEDKKYAKIGLMRLRWVALLLKIHVFWAYQSLFF